MSRTNCVNCGAAKDTSEIKCPFCGTTYLDLTAIDFSTGDPVVCEFVLPKNFRYGDKEKDRVIMSMLALSQLDEISVTNSPTYLDCGWGDRYVYHSAPPDINIGISFRPLQRKDGSIIDIRSMKGD